MSEPRTSSLWTTLEEAGGVPADYHDARVMRHYGEPAAEYGAATEGGAVFDRTHRTRLVVNGRAPGKMLDGILTGTLPAPPAEVADGVLGGRATYHAVLTAKGKMVADLWALRLGDEETAGYLLDVPVAGREGLLAHFEKFLPPRFARVEGVTAGLASLSVVGPEAANLVSKMALGLRVEAPELGALAEGEWRTAGASAADAILVMRTEDVWPEAYTIYGPSGSMSALWVALVAGGATPAGLGVWSTLRVEAGRPAYGTDMDDGTIPVEAGIHHRAIDYEKGCYTGQEVIVRIRDRGHVNRSLRQLHLGDVPAPKKGAELYEAGAEEDAGSVGWVTSAVESPKFEETVALGYVRREVEEGAELEAR